MAASNEVQTSFLGGRLSPNAQGRFDLPDYATGMAESLNGLPVEEGAWMRRSGTRFLGYTNSANPSKGASGQIKEFWLPNNVAAVIELTPGVMRIWQQDTYRQYVLDNAATTTTPYGTVAACQAVRIIQADNQAFFLDGGRPYVLTYSSGSWIFSNSGWAETDGPYLDALPGASQTNNSLGSVSDGTKSPTFTITDGAYSFVSTDVNRPIRLWSQPPAWSSSHAYSVNDVVTYQGTYWQCLVAQTGITPGQNTQPTAGSGQVPVQAWAINPYLGEWAYGHITAVNSGSQVTVSIDGSNAVPYSTNGAVIDTWMLGLFTDSPDGGWPTVGCYHQGRLWLAGAATGRFDACVSDGIGNNGTTGSPSYPAPPLFSPTDQYANVLDSSGIAAATNISPISNYLWMEPYLSGIVCGTQAYELYINASVTGDPITPTTVQVNQQSIYRAANAEPVRLGLAIAFIQAYGRRLMEYVVDVFSQRFVGRHLNVYAKDLTSAGIVKISYQEELAPVIWAVLGNGVLAGCTYRRVSQFGQEGPVFMAWHQHQLAFGRTVLWACPATDYRGRQDALMLMTQDQRGYVCLEYMQPLMDVSDPLSSTWYLDAAIAGNQVSGNDNGTNTMTLQLASGSIAGAAYAGDTVAVQIAGLYVGEYIVQGGNVIEIPYGSDPDGLFTAAYLKQQNGSYQSHIQSTVVAGGVSCNVPCVVGYPYQSTLTLLRAQTQQEARTPSGPAMGMTRRTHMYSVTLANSVTGALVSVDGGCQVTMNLVGRDQQTPINHATLYNGVHWDTVDADYTFDNEMTISQSLPYPLNVAAVGRFTRTQDR